MGLELLGRHPEGDLLGLFQEGRAVRPLQLEDQLVGGVEDASRRVEIHLRRFDRPIGEILAAAVVDADHRAAIDVVVGILGFDVVLEIQIGAGVGVRIFLFGQSPDIGYDRVRRKRGGCQRPLARNIAERSGSHLGGDFLDGLVGIGPGQRPVAHGRDGQAFGAVETGIIELVRPQTLGLIKHQIEIRRQPELLLALVEPDLERPELGIGGVDVPFQRGPQEKIVETALGEMAFLGRAVMESLIGEADPGHVLFVEFVFGGVRTGIALFPEKPDEFVAVGFRGQLQEDFPLGAGDDRLDGFEPILVFRRELVLAGHGRRQQDR